MAELQKTVLWNISAEMDGGRVEQGMFEARRLRTVDYGRRAAITAELCGGYSCVKDDRGDPTGRGVGADEEFRSYVIAHLRVSLKQSPPWFWEIEEDPTDPASVTWHVFQKVSAWQDSFRGRAKPILGAEDLAAQRKLADERSRASDGSGERAAPNATGAASPLVDDDLPPSLQP